MLDKVPLICLLLFCCNFVNFKIGKVSSQLDEKSQDPSDRKSSDKLCIEIWGKRAKKRLKEMESIKVRKKDGKTNGK